MDDAAAYLDGPNSGNARLESFTIDNENAIENCGGNQRKQKQDNIKMFSGSNVTEIARNIQILLAERQKESLTSLETDKNIIEHNYCTLQDLIGGLQSTPSWLTFETHGNHKVSIHYF